MFQICFNFQLMLLEMCTVNFHLRKQQKKLINYIWEDDILS